MVVRDSPIPLYHQLLETFHGYLDDGTWKVGDTIPSERELAERFGVSTITVRQALLTLAREGRLVRTRGKGTVVAEQPAPAPLYSYARYLDYLGGEADLSVEVLESGLAERTALPHNLASSDVLYVRRLCLRQGQPVFFQTVFVPRDVGEKVSRQDWTRPSVWDTVQPYLPHPTRTEEMIEAIRLGRFEAAVLKAQEGRLALLAERTVLAQDRPLVFDRTILRSSKLFVRNDLTG